MQNPKNFKWVLEGELLKGSRPGFENGAHSQVSGSEVASWIRHIKKGCGIRSIICLLDMQGLRLYSKLPTHLTEHYRRNGFEVKHIPIPGSQRPPLSRIELRKVLGAYEKLPKPVLIHCSGGTGRARYAASYIKRQLAK